MVHAAIGRQVAAEDVGDLPVKIEFDVQLSWDEATQPALRVLCSDSMSGAISALLRQEQRFFDTGLSRKVPSCKLALTKTAVHNAMCHWLPLADTGSGRQRLPTIRRARSRRWRRFGGPRVFGLSAHQTKVFSPLTSGAHDLHWLLHDRHRIRPSEGSPQPSSAEFAWLRLLGRLPACYRYRAGAPVAGSLDPCACARREQWKPFRSLECQSL